MVHTRHVLVVYQPNPSSLRLADVAYEKGVPCAGVSLDRLANSSFRIIKSSWTDWNLAGGKRSIRRREASDSESGQFNTIGVVCD